MRALIKQTFPRMAPLVTAGIVRVDDPSASVNEPVRETARPHAHAHSKKHRVVVTQKTAMTLAAMSAKRERERMAEEMPEDDGVDNDDKVLVRDR